MRVTTAFNPLLSLPGASVTEVTFQDGAVVVDVALRRRRLCCPECEFTTAARYDTRQVLLTLRHTDSGPEVFVRLQVPFVKFGNSTSSTLMRRRLIRAGIEHAAHDRKFFHALRRTAGTRLIESRAGLPLAAQILGHARINSSRRYFALANQQLRQCCLPLQEFACTKEGLR